ncbi:unnamed protein product [Gongylonema pulchrum]|uniref:Caveolin n=1 Tax=Gongylonema pulchrum TaxID=637853 RepID=A0A183EWV2_9BILA|nr:unnamed protein product [Gongylonema pulchrum]
MNKEENGGVSGDGKGRKMICRIWQQKSPRSYAVTGDKSEKLKKPTNIAHVDFAHRDGKGLNDHVVMDFSDVFAEPTGSHSFNWTWLVANRVFQMTSSAAYKLLAVFVAIPFAAFFGILFAVFAAASVFLCTPLGVLLGIPLNALSKVSLIILEKSVTVW